MIRTERHVQIIAFVQYENCVLIFSHMLIMFPLRPIKMVQNFRQFLTIPNKEWR